MKAIVTVLLWLTPCAFGQPVPTVMKAIVLHKYGTPDVAHYEDAPIPTPKENEVLVKVVAAGVNPADAL